MTEAFITLSEREAMARMGPTRRRVHVAIRAAWVRFAVWSWPDKSRGPSRRWVVAVWAWRQYRRTWPR